MKTVPGSRVVSKADAPVELTELDVADLPDEVQLALADIASVAREGLLAMSVAAGMAVMRAMFDAEITAACGPKGKHDPGRTASRHGAGKGSVVLGGRRVPVTRPRARTTDGCEVVLPTYNLFVAEDQLTQVVMERMLAGLATRRHTAAAEPVGAEVQAQAGATSRSAVSRRFVAQTKTALAELLARDLTGLDIKVLMIDGEHIADHCCVVALAITADGTKVPVGLWEGSTENKTVARHLLADLVERGLDATDGLLVVIDGAKALSAAVTEVFGASAAIRERRGGVSRPLPLAELRRRTFAGGARYAPPCRDLTTRSIGLGCVPRDGRRSAATAAGLTLCGPGARWPPRPTQPVALQRGVLYTDVLHARHPRLRTRPRWLLLDLAERILPELDPRLSRTAGAVLRARGVDVRTGVSVREATSEGVQLTDGEFVATRSLIWCVGVRPDPLVDQLGLKTKRGRLVVDEYLTVPGHPELYAIGDAAAVPDLTRPGELTPMTAQHAQRQGHRAAYNIAASYGHGRRRPYKHHDLGFLVDLGGTQAAANPVGVPLGGLPAKAVTRGYHLLALPGNRIRTATDWLLDAALSRQVVQLGLVPPTAVRLECSAMQHRDPGP